MPIMKSSILRHIRLTLILAATTALGGCNNLAALHVIPMLTPTIDREPTDIARKNLPSPTINITKTTTILLSTGYTRTVESNSQWQYAGRVSTGEVYRPINNVFTVEGSHVREAYIVINNHRIHGFYLPGENAYSALNPPVQILFTEKI